MKVLYTLQRADGEGIVTLCGDVPLGRILTALGHEADRLDRRPDPSCKFTISLRVANSGQVPLQGATEVLTRSDDHARSKGHEGAGGVHVCRRGGDGGGREPARGEGRADERRAAGPEHPGTPRLGDDAHGADRVDRGRQHAAVVHASLCRLVGEDVDR